MKKTNRKNKKTNNKTKTISSINYCPVCGRFDTIFIENMCYDCWSKNLTSYTNGAVITDESKVSIGSGSYRKLARDLNENY